MSMETEESPLLKVVTKQRLVKTLQTLLCAAVTVIFGVCK
jgi:hypothetical protein